MNSRTSASHVTFGSNINFFSSKRLLESEAATQSTRTTWTSRATRVLNLASAALASLSRCLSSMICILPYKVKFAHIVSDCSMEDCCAARDGGLQVVRSFFCPIGPGRTSVLESALTVTLLRVTAEMSVFWSASYRRLASSHTPQGEALQRTDSQLKKMLVEPANLNLRTEMRAR